MRTVFTTSMACAAVSLLGLLGLSGMSVAPGGEAWRSSMILAVGVFLVAWATLAFWAKRQLRLARSTAFPAGAKAAVITGGVLYVLLVVICSVG